MARQKARSRGARSPRAWNNSAFMPRCHTLADFDFALPPELIAQHPQHERSASRLL
ncbi:S-adenosylmethionine:tRNA ribosyltransferase-isomerase, partial [Methylibium sp.]|uniref:S-adenosylmethionine:tRNA ribosyltransferase-isomerase n=1 Tax=Methylibium sp. TaxID=2067992 RepID=UPI0038621BF4